MLVNRSMPSSTVIPTLAYPDVAEAVDWLCAAFGFTKRLIIGNHRAQFHIGDGAMVVTRQPLEQGVDPSDMSRAADERAASHSVMVRVADLDRHHERAKARGARIMAPPADYPYGERQYTAEDPGGHRWTFSQSIADVAPEEWGGVLINAR